jgi:hypothetical protein
MSQTASANGEKIDITDLRHPILSDYQQQVLAAASAHPVPLEGEQVLAAARQATGLSDFGDPAFRARLDLWLQSAREDQGLSPVGQAGIYSMAVRLASNRLRVEDLVKRHPEILDIEIEAPLVIAGLPRSGTSYLQSFLAADPRLRSLPYWEAARPVPAPDEQVPPGAEDPRRRLCEAEWAQQDALLPYIKAIHEFSPDHISEDVELQDIDFGSYTPEWHTHAPKWRDYAEQHDATPTYRYLKKCLQVLSFQTGTKRWLLKCPQHMEHLVPLMQVFPDATVIVTHRDPVASIQSAITAMSYSARVVRKQVEPEVIASYWIDRYQRLLRAFVRDHGLVDSRRVVDVYFHELMKDPMASVAAIYAKANLALTPGVRQRMAEFAESARSSGKYGQLTYHLERDFGLSAADIRRPFDFYFERFAARPEVQ